VAVSVDSPGRSEALRKELRLPFAILCDTDRRVIQSWGIYNARERGGIAKPATFVIEPDRTLRYASVDTVAKRVPASEIIRILNSLAETQPLRRRIYIPRLIDWFHAIPKLIRK